jgi:putative ABC transport system permease protein
MFSLQRTLTVRYLGQRWTRTLLIILSIALGVATLVATRALADHLTNAADSAVNPFTEGVDLLVDKGETGVSIVLVDEIKEVPGVKRADPMVLSKVSLPELDNRFVSLFGISIPSVMEQATNNESSFVQSIDWRIPDEQQRAAELWRLQTGGKKSLLDLLVTRRWWHPREKLKPPALLGKDLAEKLEREGKFKYDENDPYRQPTFQIRAEAGDPIELTHVGTVNLDPKVQEKLGSTMVFLELNTAIGIVPPRKFGVVSRIAVTFKEGANAEETTRQVREVVGTRANVRTVEDSNQSVRDISKGLRLGFLLGGAGALVVGLFLVYNALSVSVAERRHDIGILRSMGATRGQIARLFIIEATALGILGTLLGLPLGYGLAWTSLGPIRSNLEELFNIQLERTTISLSTTTVVLAVLCGPLTAILAALVPALRAAQEEPADAVRRVPVVVGILYRVLHLALVLALFGGGIACIVLRSQLPTPQGAYGGIVCLLLGALVATPLVAAALARFLQPMFRRILGLEGRLAADNLIRAPGRTGLVIAALAATGALLVQTSGFIHSTETALLTWIDDKIGADLFVASGSSATQAGLPMPESVGDELRADPRVRLVLPVRGHQMLLNDRIVIMLALDADQLMKADPNELTLAKTFQQFPRLTEPGTALVSENFAALNGVKVGDHLRLPGPEGEVEVEVLGTLQDYTWNRGTVIVNRRWYREAYKDTQVDLFDVWLRPGVDRDAMAKELNQQTWIKDRLLIVVTREEGRKIIVDMIRKLYGLLYVQQFIVGIVALLGVINALFISVLQRRRELGLLRAVGASRPQVLRSVLAEATLMGLIGAIIGFVVGLMLEWYVVRILLLDESGFTFPVRVPWLACLWVFVASVGLATLVGLWPAYHATRLRIPDAIAYE